MTKPTARIVAAEQATSCAAGESIPPSTWTSLTSTLSPNEETEEYFVSINIQCGNSITWLIRVYDGTNYYPNSNGIYLRDGSCTMITIPKNVNGKTLTIQVYQDYGNVTCAYWINGWGHNPHYHR